MRHGLRILALASIVLLAAWGCGGGDDDAAGTAGSGSGTAAAAAAAADESEIRALTDRFYEAYVGGDGAAACALLSEAAESQVVDDPDTAKYGPTCSAKLAAIAELITEAYGPDPVIDLTDVTVTGDGATGVLHVEGESSDATFVRENGEWRIGPEPDEST